MIVEANAADIVYTPLFWACRPTTCGVRSRPRGSIPTSCPNGTRPDTGGARIDPAAWRQVWGAGQGVGTVQAIEPVATIVERWREDYDAARRELAAG
jgi:nitronate monooxygenase